MAWTTPRTWVAGEKPSAATLNTHIRDNLAAIGDAWTSYTPTTTNVTLGNGTLTAAYGQAGKLVWFRVKLTFGSTTALTGSPTFTLPVNATAARRFTFDASLYDASAGSPHKGAFAVNSSASAISIRDDASVALGAAAPFAWTTSDEIYLSGIYEAA